MGIVLLKTNAEDDAFDVGKATAVPLESTKVEGLIPEEAVLVPEMVLEVALP